VNGITVTNTATGISITEREISKVYFSKLPAETIEAFLKEGTACNYAGGFTPQSPLIRPYLRIDGTFESVLGLPMDVVEKCLEKLNG
jgi:predicted house-cleaning NTP pyrophosphatase (Maf/HAM1 superfamily)